MKLVKFWQLVDEYPWIPRILPTYQDLSREIDDYPETINSFCGLRAVEDTISYICFRPWHDSVRSKKDTDKVDVLGKKQQLLSRTFFYDVFWHKEEERPFNRETSINLESRIKPCDVGEIIDKLEEQGGIVDAVVETMHDVDERSHDFFNGYAIYLIPI